MHVTPFDRIKKELSGMLPKECVTFLPKKWEKLGAVVVLKIPKELRPYQESVGKVYAAELGCSSALDDLGGITEVYRIPTVKLVWGSSHTETMHMENGVRYLLDPQKVMFSSGNMAERKRMGLISKGDETVVDLFAGIGYFTLAMAVHSRPKKIVACEMNPVAYDYLCKNIILNNVTGIVDPLYGDNRQVAPKGCADRVLLGYLQETSTFLTVALECLRDHKGMLHYHDLLSRETTIPRLVTFIQTIADGYNRHATLLLARIIKSYAPGINHVVLDVRIGA
jgi:tRNA wybutosine-synthesizing protein 2